MADDKKKDKKDDKKGLPTFVLLAMLLAVFAWQVSSHKKTNLENEKSVVVSESGVRKVGLDENKRERKTFVDLTLEKVVPKHEHTGVGGIHR